MFEIHRVPKRGKLLTLGILCISMLGLGFALLLAIGNQFDQMRAGHVILPATMVLLGLWFGGLFILGLLARRVIDDLVLSIETPVLHLDDSFQFIARFEPRIDVELNAITASFECIEKAYLRSGTRSRMYTKVVYQDTVKIADRQRLRSNQKSRHQGAFHTPSDGMCTFHGMNNAITWRLRLHIDVARWPDVKEDFEVQVLPILGERPAGS